MAIIAILAALLLPALAQARESSRRLVCLNNQRQIMIAMKLCGSNFNRYLTIGYYGGQTYSMSLWNKTVDKFITFGGLYTDAGMTDQNSWTCPAANMDDWHDTAIKNWPPGDPNEITLSHFHSRPAAEGTGPTWEWTAGSHPGAKENDLDPGAAITSDAARWGNWVANRHVSGLNVAYLHGHAKYVRDSSVIGYVYGLGWNDEAG